MRLGEVPMSEAAKILRRLHAPNPLQVFGLAGLSDSCHTYSPNSLL